MIRSVPCPALRLCVFDLDGTLVDSQHIIAAAMGAAFAAENLAPPAPEQVRRVVGLPLDAAIAVLAPECDPVTVAALGTRYKAAFFDLREGGAHEESLFGGIPEALDALDAAGWLLGIATGKSARGLGATLERFGLERRFVTCQNADTAPGKPAPDMLLAAMAETGCEAADTVMIGDTTYDMAMAGAAGVSAIGVAWGYHEARELTAAGAARIVEEARRIPEALAVLAP